MKVVNLVERMPVAVRARPHLRILSSSVNLFSRQSVIVLGTSMRTSRTMPKAPFIRILLHPTGGLAGKLR